MPTLLNNNFRVWRTNEFFLHARILDTSHELLTFQKMEVIVLTEVNSTRPESFEDAYDCVFYLIVKFSHCLKYFPLHSSEAASEAMMYVYHHFHGFAAKLTPEQAATLAGNYFTPKFSHHYSPQ